MAVTIFTPDRLDLVRDNLVQFFMSDEQIVGVAIAVDEVADNMSAGIDMLVVVQNGAVFASTFEKWKQRISTLYHVAYSYDHKFSPEDILYCAFVRDAMVFSLRFVRFRIAGPNFRKWQVLHDSTNELKTILAPSRQKDIYESPRRIYNSIVSKVWHYAVICANAIRVGQIWRAIKTLEYLRDATVTLAGINAGINTQDYVDADQLPEMFLIHLQHTIPTNTRVEALRRALRITVNLLYTEARLFEESQNLAVIDLQEQMVLQYIETFS